MSDIHFEASDFRVNTITTSDQSAPVFTRLASGGFVAAWNGSTLRGSGPNYGTNVSFQIFDSNGARVGNEVDAVNGSAAIRHFGPPTVTALADGGFALAYTQSGLSGNRVIGDFRSSSGALVGGGEIHTTDLHFHHDPQLATLAGGTIAAVYEEQYEDATSWEINGQLLTQQGAKIGTAIPVNTADAGYQEEPSIAALAAGGFVVTWTDFGAQLESPTSTVRAQLFDASGARVGTEFVVDSAAAGGQRHSSVAALGGGGFVVVWQDTSTAAESGTDVRGQIFDAAANKVGGEFTVATTVAGEQTLPIVRATASGGFIVTWSDNSGVGGDSSGYGVKAQLFDSTGATIGGEFLLNTVTSGDQRQSELAALGDDRYVAGWTDYSASADDPSGTAVRARIFQALRGGSGNDVVAGGADNDTIRLQDGGIDAGIGGGGNDIFYYGRSFDNLDEVVGGAGTDTLVLQGDYWDLDFVGGRLSEIEGISLQSGSITRWGQSGTSSYDYVLTMADADVAPGQQMRVNGQSLLADEAFAFDGSAETDGGRFLLYGGHGTDTFIGGSSNDIFYFEVPRLGADHIDGRGGNDSLVISGGLPGVTDPVRFDIVSGTLASIESISFNARFSNDPAARPSYDVLLHNGNATPGERLIVNASSLEATQFLKFDGSLVTDARLHIFGGAGADILTGGAHRDLFYGAGGADTLLGNAAPDVFQYRSVADSLRSAHDKIDYFERDADKIDLSLIDADTITPGDQAFRIIESAAFSGSAGELRVSRNFDLSVDASHIVEGDVDGDASADFFIAIDMWTRVDFVSSDVIL